ncbi:hypothetical protein G7054_g11195 [Neopestalotiopsis clavispora]|nr:hypothetical protein G7054_g11195 [Neopestalotiopsis clavispora]
MTHSEEASPLWPTYHPADLQIAHNGSSNRHGILKAIYNISLHVIIVFLISLLWLQPPASRHSDTVERQSWSPVRDYVEYELRPENPDMHAMGNYSGLPSTEQDRAWDGLMEPSFFRVTKDELERAGESLINLAELEDGGYPATLGVYHELHCVRQLRFYLWRHRYYPHMTNAQSDYLEYHLDHCIEVLRRTVMCRGNTALRSFAWVNFSANLPDSQSNADMSCVRWSSIDQWSRNRMVPIQPPVARPQQP